MRLELLDPEVAAELARFLHGRGFVVVRRGLLLDVHPGNHVSGRHDRLAVQAVLREWLSERRRTVLYQPDARVPRLTDAAPGRLRPAA